MFPAIIGLITVTVSILAIVVRIAWVISELRLKVDTLWEVFINQPAGTPRRRHTDKLAAAAAHDRARGYTGASGRD